MTHAARESAYFDSREPTTLADALGYAERGLPVFPCESIDLEMRCTCGTNCASPGKHPIATLAPRGFHNATTDTDLIQRWWSARPDANVAIPAGQGSGLLVLDEDQPSGAESRAQLEARHGQLPETVRVLTGGGGVQYFFRHPGRRIPCSSGRLGLNLDIRADGGYVVAPRSLHQSGRFYEFDTAADLANTPLANPPDWLIERACAPAQRERAEYSPGDDEIPEGTRNEELVRIAGALRRRGCGFDEILAALKATNEKRCRPPLPSTEVVGIARGVLRYEPETRATQQQAPGPRFKVYSIPELLHLPQPQYDFEGLVQERTFVVFAGPPGCGKSFLAVHLLLCKALGLPFYGGRATSPGPVVYVCAEGNPAKFGRRLAAFLQHRGLSADAVPLHVIAQPVQLMESEDIDCLLATLRELPERPRLVLFDTLARCALGSDENSTRDMGLVVAGADRVRTDLQTTVALVHHTRLDGTRERGNTALRGATDTLILVTKEDDVVTVVDDKQKDDPEGEPIRFRLRVVEFEEGGTSCVLVEDDGERAARAPTPLPAMRQQALEALQTGFDDGGATFTKWLETSHLSRATFGRVVQDLVSWGLIRKVKQKYVVAEA